MDPCTPNQTTQHSFIPPHHTIQQAFIPLIQTIQHSFIPTDQSKPVSIHSSLQPNYNIVFEQCSLILEQQSIILEKARSGTVEPLFGTV